MKKIIFFLTFVLGTWISANGTVNIQSVTIIPASPSDTQHVKAVVTTQFSSGSCPLINSVINIQNDTVRLTAVYTLGMLTVICNATDTFDLGILPCTMHGLAVTVAESGSITGVDLATHPLTITCVPTGIRTIPADQEFLLFPNPASRELTVKVTNENNTMVKISILNVIGEKIYPSIEFSPGKNKETTINIASLAKGIYFAKVQTGNRMVVKRFIKD